ncbi:MAG: RNA-binding protein [Bacteroidales bacterium]|nr:RNA-binding protein [Bacteroidales bacterium]MCF8350216.1 RNA-binding protein [Bacteroidales bacterium]MCF8375015.1 RNA-binding protein [Bacteroidales bacterium]MCF8401656.1 RNA-binding protein [Bacteroidales bacterium]
MNIYVGNLNYATNEDELREIFAEYGEVLSVKVITDRMTGKAKGFAFVEMANEDEANTAIQELDGAEIKGRNVKVNKANPPRKKFN